VAVNFDDGGIDHGIFHVRIVRAGIEEALEDASSGPIADSDEVGRAFRLMSAT
jgi:hypothetical protein